MNSTASLDGKVMMIERSGVESSYREEQTLEKPSARRLFPLPLILKSSLCGPVDFHFWTVAERLRDVISRLILSC